MRRIIPPLLGAVCLVGTLAPAAVTTAATPSRPPCAVSLTGQQTCYFPAQAVQAEHRVPWVSRPYSAMRLTFGLKLAQVSVVTFPGPGNRMQIDYLFGPLRKDYGRQGSSPLAIRLTEANGRVDVNRFKAKWTHSVCGMKLEISPAANPQKPHPAYGPWYAVGNFPNGKGSFGITANTGQKLIESLACRLAGNLGA